MPGVRTGADGIAQLAQLSGPLGVGPMFEQGVLQCPPGPGKRRPDRGDDPAVADHDERLMLELDAVEHVGEPSRGIGGTELLHEIRLSDYISGASAVSGRRAGRRFGVWPARRD